MKRVLLFLGLIILPFSMISNVRAANYASDTLKGKVVTSGDGLYVDKYNEGRHVYKGGNPNNFIKFNDELWRIISVEKDGTLKIIRNDVLDEELQFNSEPEHSFIGSYCAGARGCNAWGKSEYFDGGYSTVSTSVYHYYGTVTEDSTLNNFLNNDYYSSISDTDKCKIISRDFYFGPVGNNDGSLSKTIESERSQIWNGNIGLPNVSDMLIASLNENTCGTREGMSDNSVYTYIDKDGNNVDSCTQFIHYPVPIEGCKTYYKNNCSEGNYLMFKGEVESTINSYYLFINAVYNSVGSVYANSYRGFDWFDDAVKGKVVRPVTYLRSDIKILSGDGSENNPYEIKCDECDGTDNSNTNDSNMVVNVPPTSMFISVFIIGGFILIILICLIIYLKVFKKKDIK